MAKFTNLFKGTSLSKDLLVVLFTALLIIIPSVLVAIFATFFLLGG